MKRILVVNVNWLGDVIFSSSIFRALRAQHPDAHISCMAPPRVKEILERIDGIDEIIVYDEENEHFWPWAKLWFIFQLRRRKFDVAYLLHRSLTRALLASWAGIPQIIGYDTKTKNRYLTKKVQEHAQEMMHRADIYLNVIETDNVQVQDRTTRLNINSEIRKEAEKILLSSGIGDHDYVVVVNTGGNWDLKRWPKQYFSQLIAQLTNELNVKVVIPGAPDDAKLAQEIMQEAKTSGVINLAGKTTLKQLMGIMERADLVISSDSGPLHMASSLGTDVIGVFGPTRPEITGPRGNGKKIILQKDVGCNQRACYFLQCPDNICMKAVSVKDVVDAVRQIKGA